MGELSNPLSPPRQLQHVRIREHAFDLGGPHPCFHHCFAGNRPEIHFKFDPMFCFKNLYANFGCRNYWFILMVKELTGEYKEIFVINYPVQTNYSFKIVGVDYFKLLCCSPGRRCFRRFVLFRSLLVSGHRHKCHFHRDLPLITVSGGSVRRSTQDWCSCLRF